ncbi:hypothetical protein F5050DRAFT_1578979 [Lentinula boryana]|uniref:Uncharacterized protein n=1 Tax=Lentinula boryana TaxID=40481 RepID=A0ABQ8Q248_9AGAR|nr:hypothetical protein GGU11DRAFT_688568 [Lentinula aff. detonsa]KAJ3992753.1 hypothetical protein F5050DRAFT_1578979 [Lentinula boryana]
MCWGFAKRIYREFPSTTKEADLKVNMIKSLDSVPLISMRKFSNRCDRFIDAYRKGFSGSMAAWATKKYRGHRVIPENVDALLAEFHSNHPSK